MFTVHVYWFPLAWSLFNTFAKYSEPASYVFIHTANDTRTSHSLYKFLLLHGPILNQKCNVFQRPGMLTVIATRSRIGKQVPTAVIEVNAIAEDDPHVLRLHTQHTLLVLTRFRDGPVDGACGITVGRLTRQAQAFAYYWPVDGRRLVAGRRERFHHCKIKVKVRVRFTV